MKKYLFAVATALLGLVASTHASTFTVFPTSNTWRFAKGTTEASSPDITAWRSNTFNDVNFVNAQAPFWYGDVLPGGTQITDMLNGYLCFFLRKEFVVTNFALVNGMQLGALIDDGFVAWINGFEVLRVNPPPEPFTITSSVAAAATEPVPFVTYSLPIPTNYLKSATNILTIQVFNAGIGSSDINFDAGLTASVDDVAPFVFAQAPLAGSTVRSLVSVQVNFSENVTGVEAADLLINNVPATNVIAASPSIYTFTFTQPATGSVSVTLAPNEISDTFGNGFAGASWSYTLDPNAPLLAFYISEFLASNNGNGTNGIRDEDGDASDWIEIYNPNSLPQLIGGWYLTDSTNVVDRTRWRFPDGASVPGFGYMIVFASGKNRTNNLGRLHTNFQLANGGEYLALLDPQTNIVSQFYPSYPAQQQNVSYGRDKANPSIVGQFPVPTPGADNSPGSNPGLAVQFSRGGGTFAGTFQLTLSTSDTNNRIYYNIVNSAQDVNTATNIPGTNATLYTGPITVNNTVQVRARAFPAFPTSFPGPVRTESYILVDPGITNFVSTLPIVVIHTLATAAISGGFPALDNSVVISCFDNTGGTASIMNPPQMIKRAGINLRGSSTQGFPKSSFAVELWDEFNDDDEASFAGLPQESDWVLYAPNQFDISLMHNPLMHQFGRDFGYYSSRTRFVEVFYRNGAGAITGNTNLTGTGMGDYYGVFVLEEKVKRDGSRVDIDVLQPEQTNAAAITGGYLLKVDRTDPNERTFVGGSMTINYVEPDGLEMVTAARTAQANYIKGYLDTMNAGLQGNLLTNVASANHYSKYIDVEASLDLHIVNVLVMNADAYRLSGYMYKPRGGKLVMGPLWDVDRGLGTSRGDVRTFNPLSWQSYDSTAAGCVGGDYGTDFFGGSINVNTWTWFNRLFSDIDFWQLWIDRYQHARTTILETNRVAAIVDKFANEVRPAHGREVSRWSGNGGSATQPRSGPTTVCSGIYSHNFPGTYQGEIDFQKRWLLDHINFMDTNFLNRPSLSVAQGYVPLGTVVTLTDNSGKAGTRIYYTLDGSDPRGFQGNTNPAAILYTGPISITNNVRIHARAMNPAHQNMTGTTASGARNPIVSTPWSGNIANTYIITTPPLVISELMFAPAPPTSLGDTNDADNFEYVELKNIGSTTLNLVGFRFTNGIDFTFTATSGVTNLAPGGHVLIVKHLAAFNSRYPGKTNVAGVYSGSLDNAGERITFVGPRLEPILDFTYSDSWYPLSDSLGFSLIIINPNAPLDSWGDKDSWRTSAGDGGSPGVVDPAPPNIPVVLINEALTHTDLPQVDVIELFNPGASDANIGGWFLSDDAGEPKKYLIPPGTTISAGGYLLFNESQFNSGLFPFSLGSDGDDVFLFSATNGVLTGFAHGFDFGPAQNGVTFGRYVNSQGNEDFVAQSANTLGATNVLPLIGPIVISEIMYHPPDVFVGTNLTDNSIDEYVELYNITANAVPLYALTNTVATWKLDKAITFTFPTNISIAPTSFVLVVNFNPTTNPAQLAAFRAKFGISPSIPVYGPYGGSLDNSGGNIHLTRPDNPNPDGIPYILVDRVQYNDAGAWPQAPDGAGASLQRIVRQAYGNDPTNWVGATPTPGIHVQGGTPPVITQQPSNATVFAAGANATSTAYLFGTTNFTAGVSGTGVKFVWLFNGSPIPGATNAILTLTNIQYTQSGQYSLLAFNGGGSVSSSNATLTVVAPVTFTVQPVSQYVSLNTNVTLVSAASGTGPVTYQWRFEGTNIPNATNASYSFTGANIFQHHGIYTVVARDSISTAVSADARIYVMARPGIIQQPTSQTVPQGGTAVFSLVVTGATPMGFRWVRNNGNGFDPIYTSEPVLVLPNVQVGYPIRVIITNQANLSGLGSGTVNLIVTTNVINDADSDGIPDEWEVAYFGSVNTTNNAANALEDPDGDLMNNRAEYIAGTNPTDPLSLLKLAITVTNATVLQFVAQTNVGYTVQAATTLTSPVWNRVSNILASPSVRTIEVNTATAPGVSERYIRVVTPLVP